MRGVPGIGGAPVQVEALREVLNELGTREPPALEKRLSWVLWVRRGWGVAGARPGGPWGTPNPPLVGVRRRG